VVPTLDPISHWNALLEDIDAADLCASLAGAMRARRLRFGDRVLCPFLRPFFLDAGDEARVRAVVELLWTLGERVARVAIDNPAMLADLALSEAEVRLARIDPGYHTSSTAARADAFIQPDSLQFAEYNGESPAGAGYSQGLAKLFDEQVVMARFRERFDARLFTPVERILDALVESYREWGGTALPPRVAIVDWRDVPTYSEFEIMRDAFAAAGVPTTICDPRDLDYRRGRGLFANGERVDLVYRRVLINDIVSREDESRPLLDAYADRAVCVANTLRCKIPHKKAFFAVLTDSRHASLFTDEERALIRRHIPWTVLIEERRVSRDGESYDLVPYLRRRRETLVIKPNDEYGGTGVTLGWDTDERAWDVAIGRALRERDRGWVAQERIAVRREPFPICDGAGVAMRDMLVDLAPYVFRGRFAGFLTRLSATGLANVTSGGGQVPAFVVSQKSEVRS
jgi:uncharacterized circularly permuted ATP-grasp superfamily protein